MLKPEEVIKQSNAAFAQWDETWRKHSKINGNIMRSKGTSFKDIIGSGVGKTLTIVAMGPSLENQIETIKANRSKTDVLCIDKAMGVLIDHGIIPDYVIIADAGISFEKYCEPWIEHTKQIKLLSNVNANIRWTRNWLGDIYFYVNKDNINSHEIYGNISGCHDIIPASSNVGNSAIVLSTIVLGYDKYLLVGYDFCWYETGNYYAFSDDEKKRYFMKHHYFLDIKNKQCVTSANLLFSCRWLVDYINGQLNAAKIKIFNCSDQGILSMPARFLNLEYSKNTSRQISEIERQNIIKERCKSIRVTNAKDLNEAIEKYNVVDIIINHIDNNTMKLFGVAHV